MLTLISACASSVTVGANRRGRKQLRILAQSVLELIEVIPHLAESRPGKFDDPSTHLSPPILAQATLAMSSEVPLTAYSRAHLEAMLSRPESVLLRESWAQVDLSRRAERLLVVTSFLWLTLTLDKLYLSQGVEINVELFLGLLPASAAAWCRRRLSRIREECTPFEPEMESMFQHPFGMSQDFRAPVDLLAEFAFFYTPTPERYQADIWSVLSRALSTILPGPIRP
ncbi:uncharacterized protein PAN0_010d4069 [Moesziomyces antarcticus]|uniref:Uncharacterized protein n=1 Tax=Pseudozyma antarctica TaxID=84753 RepID=A0A081CGQ1_PSEA2|nr:uncharacterized protein PAN0_010d4069 [Moesziomyces antarcticus]GAK65847.1 hypothetical protein PAN0_010d4069 [Moesziomyces antarcticus]